VELRAGSGIAEVLWAEEMQCSLSGVGEGRLKWGMTGKLGRWVVAGPG
jgi:hypothetical protein